MAVVVVASAAMQ
jgi:hypothetical protein